MCGQSGTDCQSVCRPPVAWQPHSMMWPAKLPPAKRSQSVSVQPNSCISGPSVTALSTTRPVMTMSAPSASACATPRAPRYALALARRSGSGWPVALHTPLARSAGSCGNTSSPSTTATRGWRGSWSAMDAASACTAAAQPCGYMPPALATTLMPWRISAGSTAGSALSTKSVA